jgi:glutathione synthase
MSSFVNNDKNVVKLIDIDDSIIIERVQWCLTHGIVMANKKDIIDPLIQSKASLSSLQSVQHAPFSLYPYQYPLQSFNKAIRLSYIFNKVIDRISRNSSWLMDTLKSTASGDPFTGRLLDIYDTVNKEGIKQHVSLGLLRSDYMLHVQDNDPRSFLQVEINTIASSFGSLSTKISEMHRSFEVNRNIPENIALDELCDGLAAAHYEYIRQIKKLQLFYHLCLSEEHVNFKYICYINI